MIAELTETADTAAPAVLPGRNGQPDAEPEAEAGAEAAPVAQQVDAQPTGGAPESFVSGAEAVALVEVLVRALEHRGTVFRPESSLTRLLAVALGRELELCEAHLNALALAALLSDLGGMAVPGAGEDPRRAAAVTLQLLEGVALPAGVHEALAHQHEHWDGSGSPGGLSEDGIPFPARILAVARGYARLVAGGDGRGPLSIPAALDEMQRQAGSVFDPVVSSLLRRVFAARERHGIGYGWGGQILVAHPEELRGLGLATRLHAAGYVTETAGGLAGVRERLRGGPVQALVLGAGLGEGDVARLVQEIRASAQLRGVPVLVIDAESPDQRIGLLSAGADVCFAPEVGFTEFRATLDACLRRGDLVSGSAEPAAPYGRAFA